MFINVSTGPVCVLTDMCMILFSSFINNDTWYNGRISDNETGHIAFV